MSIRDFFKKYKILILFVVLIFLKVGTYYSQDIIYFFKVQTYNNYVDEFTKIKPTEAMKMIDENNSKVLIYFGRNNCPTCLNLIKNIKIISEEAYKENIPFFYIDEKNNLSIEDIALIDNVFKIKYIPCIVNLEKDKITIYDSRKLESKNFKNDFRLLLNED